MGSASFFGLYLVVVAYVWRVSINLVAFDIVLLEQMVDVWFDEIELLNRSVS